MVRLAVHVLFPLCKSHSDKECLFYITGTIRVHFLCVHSCVGRGFVRWIVAAVLVCMKIEEFSKMAPTSI